ncbi:MULTISPECIES: hypothetical protein [unclassified Moorena]|nr:MULTISPECIES: hypothetical protein [unclassified Moorena]NEO15084.1 hypothetical protein [Moorena sp. SIO3E8]NEQ01671.1 hypothetical protein [Moorena sp. SIO3F7]
MLANDIDHLIDRRSRYANERLDAIIDAAKSQRSRIGFFPALYRLYLLTI